jgi:putative oxidoreductase
MTARVSARFRWARRRTIVDLALSGPTEGPVASIAFATRLIAGGIFIAFGVGKFVNHGSELASFRHYGLPSPDVFVSAIGALELVGGGALILGLGTRLAAVVLAGDMVGAIVVSGIARGEIVSLTVAPAQLLAMLVLIWIGGGSHALERHLGLEMGRPEGPGS